MRFNKAINSAAAVLLGMAYASLPACIGQSTVPQDHYYRLPDIVVAPDELAGIVAHTLSVAKPRSEGVYQERAILFSEADNLVELHPYHYQHWIKAPAVIIQDSLIEYLRQLGVAPQVQRFVPGKPTDVVINGTILKFERIIKTDGGSVIVALEFEVDLPNSRNRVLSKVFKSEVQFGNASMQASINAFAEALQTIYKVLSQDLRRVIENVPGRDVD